MRECELAYIWDTHVRNGWWGVQGFLWGAVRGRQHQMGLSGVGVTDLVSRCLRHGMTWSVFGGCDWIRAVEGVVCQNTPVYYEWRMAITAVLCCSFLQYGGFADTNGSSSSNSGSSGSESCCEAAAADGSNSSKAMVSIPQGHGDLCDIPTSHVVPARIDEVQGRGCVGAGGCTSHAAVPLWRHIHDPKVGQVDECGGKNEGDGLVWVQLHWSKCGAMGDRKAMSPLFCGIALGARP